MKIYCSCCGKQALNQERIYSYTTTLIGAVADVGNKVICGVCAKDLDENGLFPEERVFYLEGEQNESN
jgi:hypothetical protein